MLTQKAFTEPTTEEPQTQPLQEIKYRGHCYGQQCFIMESKSSIVGYCEKTKAFIMVDLAKKQMLCDTQQTRYHPNYTANKQKQPTKNRK